MGAETHVWRCACCGKENFGLPMDMAFPPPADWDSVDGETRDTALVDDDFCALRFPDGEVARFIRCLLHLPVPALAGMFRFGVWMSVSEESWDVYRRGFDTGEYAVHGCFGYLMHDIPDYEGSLHLHADVMFQPDRLRPSVELREANHPLFAAQREGVDVAQIERWAALAHGS